MKKFRALIVDDMKLARKRVRRYLAEDAEIEIVGECGNGREAIKAIEATAPDLVFLDVQMPALDGFEVLQAVGIERMPAVVFVTAYEEHALRAFDVHAVDYLLKPFDPKRLQVAVARAKHQVATGERSELDRRLGALLRDVKPEPKYLTRMAIKSSGRTVFLSDDEIDWVETAGNYLRIHAGQETYLIRERMNQFEVKLDPDKLVRIHRSTIVNVGRIKETRPLFNSDQVVILRDGTKLSLSRTYRDRLFSVFPLH